MAHQKLTTLMLGLGLLGMIPSQATASGSRVFIRDHYDTPTISDYCPNDYHDSSGRYQADYSLSASNLSISQQADLTGKTATIVIPYKLSVAPSNGGGPIDGNGTAVLTITPNASLTYSSSDDLLIAFDYPNENGSTYVNGNIYLSLSVQEVMEFLNGQNFNLVEMFDLMANCTSGTASQYMQSYGYSNTTTLKPWLEW